MTISASGSLQQNHGTGITTLTVATPTIGNCWVLVVRAASTSISVTGVSGGGPNAWSQIAAFNDTLTAARLEIWLGTVKSTSSTTVTVTWSGTNSVATEYLAQAYSSTLGSPNWAGVQAGGTTDGTGTAITWASLTPPATDVYAGYTYVAGTAVAGSTTGFTYTVTAASNCFCYNTAASGATAPTCTQTPSGNWSTIAALVTDNGMMPANALTLSQPFMRAAVR